MRVPCVGEGCEIHCGAGVCGIKSERDDQEESMGGDHAKVFGLSIG